MCKLSWLLLPSADAIIDSTAHSASVKDIVGTVVFKPKVFRQTVIEDKKGEFGFARRDSNQMKDIWVPG
jgi:hypothetical protein